MGRDVGPASIRDPIILALILSRTVFQRQTIGRLEGFNLHFKAIKNIGLLKQGSLVPLRVFSENFQERLIKSVIIGHIYSPVI